MMHSQEIINEGYGPIWDRQSPSLTLLKEPEEDYQTYRIADLNVAIKGEGQINRNKWVQYFASDVSEPDFVIDIKKEFLDEIQFYAPLKSREDCADFAVESAFHEMLFRYDGFMLHSSAVVLDKQAYLFSAPSGTGKSTHTSFWIKRFGEDHARIINDDGPIIRKINDRYFAFGSPWSGRSKLNLNEGAPLKAIAFLERSEENWIHPLNHVESIFMLLNHSKLSSSSYNMDKLMRIMPELLSKVAIYRFGCTESLDAVDVSYSAMSAPRGDANVF